MLLSVMETKSTRLNPWDIGGLIISPTRELAQQIHNVATEVFHLLKTFQPSNADSNATNSKNNATNSKNAIFAHPPVLFIGGGRQEKKEINGCNLLIGTPGRIASLLDILDSGTGGGDVTNTSFPPELMVNGNVKKLEVLVLDEADRLLALGFERTLSRIFSTLPKQRRTGLFSATQTKELKSLARAGMRNPVYIAVKLKPETQGNAGHGNAGHGNGGHGIGNGDRSSRTPLQLENFYCICEESKRFAVLLSFLQDLAYRAVSENNPTKVIIFFSTCACVDYFPTVSALLFLMLNPTPIPTLKGCVMELLRVLEVLRVLERLMVYRVYRYQRISERRVEGECEKSLTR